MKFLFASILIASLSAAAVAQTAAPAGAKPTAKPTSKPAAKPAAKKGAHKGAPVHRTAIEMATPLEDADPTDKLTPAELEIAKRVYVGEIPCELGAKVVIKARKRPGYFLVSHGINRFVMHPVESRTGAIRLEDPERGALFLQIANKSMLLNQKEGKRLADECQSPEQLKFAQEMKNRPPVNILEPAPAARPEPAASAAPAVAANPTTPAAAAAPAATPPAQ